MKNTLHRTRALKKSLHGVSVLFALCLWLSVCRVAAQQMVLPYFNGWEDEEENRQWVMNSGKNADRTNNKWYVSSKEHFCGRHALVISDILTQKDTLAVYSDMQVSIIAARTFDLPKGDYDLSFVWRAGGEQGRDGLYVAWIYDTDNILTSVTNPPSWASTAGPYKGRMFCGSDIWQVERTWISSSGNAPMKLAFLWVNDRNNTCNMPSVCIDNVQIASTDCGHPGDVTATVNGRDVTLTWTPTPNATYEVWYFSDYAGVSDTIKVTGVATTTLTDMPKGVYDFHVRTICFDGTTSIWSSALNVIMNEGLCLDYTNLRRKGVTCYVGTAVNPYEKIEVADHVIDGEAPRHKVNINRHETDPRTAGMLKVIPDGEVVSVRLGNEMAGTKGEAIEYDMHLDAGRNTVLLMKYAVVLQAPDHEEAEMPWFKLDVLDKLGKPLDKMGCGEIYFFPDLKMVGENGWHQIGTSAGGATPVMYKDWTTMGLMLGEYTKNGPIDIKVRLTTRDCTHTEHYGYAYFTLDCIEGEISGLSCGNIPTTQVRAPEGFDYRWYAEDDKNQTVVSDSAALDVKPGDFGTYICDVMIKENPDCHFPMRVDLMPRTPVADAKAVWCPENCQNFVAFENQSRIMLGDAVSDDVITDFRWEFSNGETSTEKNPRIAVPDEGGQITARLMVGISDWSCTDEWKATVDVMPIHEVRDTTVETVCKGKPFIINGNPYYDEQDIEIPSGSSNFSGCDSTHVVRLKVVESFSTAIDSTICAGDTVSLWGNKYWFSGEFQKTLRSSGGCDSIVTLRLTVLSEVQFGYDTREVAEEPNSGAIILKDTLPGTWYTIDDVENGRLDSLPVGTYIIVCYNDHGCASEPVRVTITVDCLEVSFGAASEVCSGDTLVYLPFEVLGGTFRKYSLLFGEKERETGFADKKDAAVGDEFIEVKVPATASPDRYGVSVVAHDAACGNDTIAVEIPVLYPADIIRQKWNDVVALLNAANNGGHEFSAYQWYRNGEIMTGETDSYVYLDDDAVFVDGDEFRVEVTRLTDGVRLMTCPFVTTLRSEVRPCPTATLVMPAAEVKVSDLHADAVVRLWSVAGVYHGEQAVSVENPAFTAPAVSGVYVVRIVGDDFDTVYKILVKE